MTWRKRFAIWRNRFYLYPAPEDMPHTRLFWLAMGLVALAAAIFSAYFIYLHLGRQDAYLTPAEDLGTYNQAVWNILHGTFIHQTICNIVSDTNCYSLNGIPRFAIHVEPILLPISLLYLPFPDPKTLLILQTLVVASGAFPAFWLARLRLRNELVAVGIAVLYLLYPAQQQAEVFDFHAVTLTAALLMFTLYFMYTRRTLWLFVFAILSMACKEEIPLVIAFFGLWSILFQQRWRTGLALVGLSIAWLGLVFLVYRIASPTGHPLLGSRYAYLGSGPLQILRNIVTHPLSLLYQHVLEHSHRQYIIILLAPAAFLPLLAPWVLMLAVPSIAINLFSSDPNQYLGIFHYSAEIVPVLVFSTIEAMVFIVWLVKWYTRQLREARASAAPKAEQASGDSQGEGKRESRRDQGDRKGRPYNTTGQPVGMYRFARWAQPVGLCVLLGLALFAVVHEDFTYGAMPFSRGFGWPNVTAHDQLAGRIENMIPASASVSAQSELVPHVSQRAHIYLFPYGDTTADYIFLDVTGVTYPYSSPQYIGEVKKVLLGGNYGIVTAQDGYLLLKRGLPAPGAAPYSQGQTGDGVVPNLPDAFCSFTRVSPNEVQHALQVDFTPTQAVNSSSQVSLVGYNIAPPSSFGVATRFMQVTAYWKVNAVNTPPLKILTILTDQNGKEEFSSVDFPTISWCPTMMWQPGTIVRTVSSTLYIGNVPVGLAHVGLALLPFNVPFGTILTVTNRVPLHVISAPAGISQISGTNALQIGSFTIVP
ncbi:MAG TPA: DUF2079 domain-containing protein [Ktedonobacteraceae bacterium]|nr:DUF2079 domain-containing protein [Ktedonobacteraceae bacterium]